MTDGNELVYYGPLVIGNDLKAMQFDFDTGSDFIWVPLINCTSCHTIDHHTIGGPDVYTGNTGKI